MSDTLNTITLEGWLSIRAALIAKHRPIYKVYLQEGNTDKQYKSIIRRVEEQGLELNFISRDELDEMATGRSHGGSLALVGPRYNLEATSLGQGSKASFVVILDGIEDPYNLGQALRSLHASGCHGVILPKRNWDSATAIIGRASAGAAEFIKVAQSDDLESVIKHYKAQKLNFICTDRNDRAVPLFKSNLKKSSLIMIGGEKRGIKKNILNLADSVARIPYGRDFQQSLDSTSAVAVVAFEVLRQRFF